jgi:beta-1,2-mannobiose phosphorylase / 1,2-beta-oligomannan phosphorylase
MIPIFVRSESNPILTARDMPMQVNSVFNPGAILLRNGQTALLLRVEDTRGLSSIHVARSTNGATDWTVDATPLLAPDPTQELWEWGFEDARVVFVQELDRYVVTCTAYGSPGACVYLATSEDLTTIDHGAVVMPPDDKNAALFPRRLDGKWLLLHRPVAMNGADIWLSRSDDLESWRLPERMILCRERGWWDAARIGIGPPPIETDEGWIQLYHGVRVTTAGSIYRVGAALLDLEQPWKVRRQMSQWLLSPTEPYERIGDVGNVVFPCGAVQRSDRQEIDLYYGAADTVVCMATISEDSLLRALLHDEEQSADRPPSIGIAAKHPRA